MTRALVAVAALLILAGCEGLLDPSCSSIGVYPTCSRSGDVYLCGSETFVCSDLTAQYTCKDHGGVLCRVD